MSDSARLLATTFGLGILLACSARTAPAPEAEPSPIASSTPAQSAAAASATPVSSQLASTPVDAAQADVLRESFRALAESYVALVRSGQPGEAWRYLPKDLQQQIPEAAHAAWWKSAVSPADLPRVYIGAVAVEPGGGFVSVVTPARSQLLRIIGAEKPGIVPLDLLTAKSTLAAGAKAADWMPLTAGAGASFGVQRETVIVTSLATDLGKPEWRDRLTGVLREEVTGPDTAVDGLAATLVKTDRPVNKADDASVPETRRMWLQSTKRGIVIVAEQDSEESKPYREKPETLLLPAELRLGAHWDGGSAVVEDVPVKLGFDLAAVGDGGDTIEVRGFGAGSAKEDAVTARAEISIRRWYGKGVGLVREIRQESLRKTGASGASFERTKMTVRSRLARPLDHVLAFAVNAKEIVREPAAPRTRGASIVFPDGVVPASAASKYDPVADQAAFEAAKAQASAELQAKGAEWKKSGKYGTFSGRATVEGVPNGDGTYSYKPNVSSTIKTVPTPRIFLGSGGE